MAPPSPDEPPLPPREAAYFTPPGLPAAFDMPPPPPTDWASTPNEARPDVTIKPFWTTLTAPPLPDAPPEPPSVKLPDLDDSFLPSELLALAGTFSIPTAFRSSLMVLADAVSAS